MMCIKNFIAIVYFNQLDQCEISHRPLTMRGGDAGRRAFITRIFHRLMFVVRPDSTRFLAVLDSGVQPCDQRKLKGGGVLVSHDNRAGFDRSHEQ